MEGVSPPAEGARFSQKPPGRTQMAPQSREKACLGTGKVAGRELGAHRQVV